jgi:hypothetical protein
VLEFLLAVKEAHAASVGAASAAEADGAEQAAAAATR